MFEPIEHLGFTVSYGDGCLSMYDAGIFVPVTVEYHGGCFMSGNFYLIVPTEGIDPDRPKFFWDENDFPEEFDALGDANAFWWSRLKESLRNFVSRNFGEILSIRADLEEAEERENPYRAEIEAQIAALED